MILSQLPLLIATPHPNPLPFTKGEKRQKLGGSQTDNQEHDRKCAVATSDADQFANCQKIGVHRAPLREIDRTSEAIPSCIGALSLGTLRSP